MTEQNVVSWMIAGGDRRRMSVRLPADRVRRLVVRIDRMRRRDARPLPAACC